MIAAYLSQVFLIAFNIWMARYHSRLLKRDRKIKHGLWGGLYLLLAGGLSLCFGWWFFLSTILLRKFLFDTALNLYRGIGLFYVSPELATYKNFRDAIRKGKVIDYVHFKLFGIHSEIYQTVYFMMWVVLMIKFAKGI